MRSARPSSDRGSVSAEVAVSLPALLVVFGLCVNGMMAGVQRLVLTDQTAAVARLVSRGNTLEQAQGIMGVQGVTVHTEGDLVCVVAVRPLGIFPVTARSCALAERQ